MEELLSLVDAGSEWTTENGVNGRVFGSDDKTVFFPAAGTRRSSVGSLLDVGSSGIYWSSTPNSERAYSVGFSNGDVYMYNGRRSYGFSVRCVAESIR